MEKNNFVKNMSIVSEISSLRKNGRLKEAYDMAVQELDLNPDDSWIQMSLFWVLRDSCHVLIEKGEKDRCRKYLDKMAELLPTMVDNKGIGRHSYEKLRQSLSPDADRMIHASELSKTDPESAFEKVFCFVDSPESLDRSQHEQFGWILYRYLKSEIATIETERFTALTEVYLALENERPSMLHSTMMKLALCYVKEHKNFKFADFLISWDVELFLDEDYDEQRYNGKNIPSLVERVCRQLASCSGSGVEILLGKTDISDDEILEYFREGVFWNLMNIYKEGRKDVLYDAFYDYVDKYSSYGGSFRHSEILKLAMRCMNEQDSWRFLDFFRKWGYENLSKDDFRDVSDENGNVAKSLAVRVAKKCFEVVRVKRDKDPDLLAWMSVMFDYIIARTVEDEWVTRQRAIIHIWGEDYEKARDIFKSLLLKMGDKYYIWSELAECVEDDDLKLALMSKSLLMEKNEDYIGNIRLAMAEVLIRKGMSSEAAAELDRYRGNRERLSVRYESLSAMIPASIVLSGNNVEKVYKRFAPLAEEYLYSDLPEQILTLVEMWESEGRKFCILTDGQSRSVRIKVKKFRALNRAKVGDSFRVKCNSSGTPVWLVSDNTPMWHSLPKKYGFVEYLNEAKKILHIATSDSELVFYPFSDKWGSVMKGDFVSLRVYDSEGKKGKTLRCADLSKETDETALSHFQSSEVIVDNVNELKRLFHITMGQNRPGCIVSFDNTELRPQEGDRLVIRYYFSKDRLGIRRLRVVSILK